MITDFSRNKDIPSEKNKNMGKNMYYYGFGTAANSMKTKPNSIKSISSLVFRGKHLNKSNLPAYRDKTMPCRPNRSKDSIQLNSFKPASILKTDKIKTENSPRSNKKIKMEHICVTKHFTLTSSGPSPVSIHRNLSVTCPDLTSNMVGMSREDLQELQERREMEEFQEYIPSKLKSKTDQIQELYRGKNSESYYPKICMCIIY